MVPPAPALPGMTGPGMLLAAAALLAGRAAAPDSFCMPLIKPCTWAIASGDRSADNVQPPTCTVFAGASPPLSAPAPLPFELAVIVAMLDAAVLSTAVHSGARGNSGGVSCR